MNDTRTPLDGFEQRLLTELIAEVERGPEPAARPQAARRRRFAVAGAAVLAVGAAAAVAGPMLIDSSAPRAAAYTLHTEHDGTIHVTINRLQDPDGLERAFAEHGVKAQVDYVPKGKACAPRHYRHGVPKDTNALPQGLGVSARVGDSGHLVGPYQFQVNPAQITGLTLVIVTSESAMSGPAGLPGGVPAMDLADGPVPPCTLVDAPAN